MKDYKYLEFANDRAKREKFYASWVVHVWWILMPLMLKCQFGVNRSLYQNSSINIKGLTKLTDIWDSDTQIKRVWGTFYLFRVQPHVGVAWCNCLNIGVSLGKGWSYRKMDSNLGLRNTSPTYSTDLWHYIGQYYLGCRRCICPEIGIMEHLFKIVNTDSCRQAEG